MGKKILVVDDEIDLMRVVTFRLKKAGYQVTEATDGQKALDLIQERKPDLILLDLRLPVVDGWEVCLRIKGAEEFRHIPVIILSASATAIQLEKIQELKAEDCLLKPFDPEVLLEKVKKFIGQPA